MKKKRNWNLHLRGEGNRAYWFARYRQTGTHYMDHYKRKSRLAVSLVCELLAKSLRSAASERDSEFVTKEWTPGRAWAIRGGAGGFYRNSPTADAEALAISAKSNPSIETMEPETRDSPALMKLDGDETTILPVLIIGAGPAGLATAACLSRSSIPALILEREDCIASLWRYRTYDRLHLHLPKHFCNLPLHPMPASYPQYPSRDQFLAYLESYRLHFGIEPVCNTTVTSAEFSPQRGLWVVTAKQKTKLKSDSNVEDEVVEFMSRSLVVATGENADPHVPRLFGDGKFGGEVSHGMAYRNGAKYANQKVLVVGAGNTGMEVALDLANFGARPWLSARSQFHVMPRDLFGLAISTFQVILLLRKVFPEWFVEKCIVFFSWLTLGSTAKYGLVRPKEGPLKMKARTGHTPVLDVGTVAKVKSGDIKVVPAIDQLTPTGAIFVNGVEEDFDAVIMATGYASSVCTWLKDEGGMFGGDGFPLKRFPNGWKGPRGLYGVGFGRRGLLACAHDAMLVANDIAKVETRINPDVQT